MMVDVTHLNLELLCQWDADLDGDARDVLKFILSGDGFRESLLSPTACDRNIRRTKLPIDSRLDLENWQTIETMQFSDVLFCLKAFQVEKKSLFDRLVLDGTPLNRVSIDSQWMGLNSIHFIFKNIMEFEFGFTVDAKSYFYQFKTHEDVWPYFGILFSQRRGRALCRALSRLCMGWRHAPAIAQRSSRTILKETSRRLSALGLSEFFMDVWLDNFIFVAHSIAECELIWTVFIGVCSDLNLKN